MPSVDTVAFRDVSYGLYIVTSASQGRVNGQLVNTVIQVTADPPRFAVILNQKNLTHDLVRESRVFAAMVLDRSATLEFLGPFGFKSGRDVDKLSRVNHRPGVTGCPIVTDHCLSAIEVAVTREIPLGTHTIFVGDVVNAEVLKQGKPMTYRFYHENLRGRTGVNAPTYTPPAKQGGQP